MPYEGEYATGESLRRLEESPAVKNFLGTIRRGEGIGAHGLPDRLEPTRGIGQVTRLVVIDSSAVTHTVENGYPGAEASLFNLAAVVLDLAKIREYSSGYLPGPEEMRQLERCETLSAVLPGRNVVRSTVLEDSALRFFRATIRAELDARLDPGHESVLETYSRITGRESGGHPIQCPVEECPLPKDRKITVGAKDAPCECDRRERIYVSDALRTQERFSNEGSSEQAFTAFRIVVEHLVLVNILRYFERTDGWDILRTTGFVLDGPLAIFGMPAWLKQHVQREIARLHRCALESGGPGILLMGVEKSGQFLDHLRALDWEPERGDRGAIENGTALAPDKAYTHRHIVLRPEDAKAHGHATYYGRKVLYKNAVGQHSVITTPIVNDAGQDRDCTSEDAFPRIGEALDIMDELGTHLYADGFAPLVRAHAHAAIPLRAGTRMLEEIFRP